MNTKFIYFFLLLFFMTTPVFAFFCPSNFNQIEFGNTASQVIQQCGKPNKEVTKEITDEGAQAWDYYFSQPVLLNNNQPSTGTLKTSIVFDGNNKAINISVNGLGVGNTTICGQMIQLGDTRDSVKQACGDPAFVNKQTDKKEKKHTIVEFTYGTTVLVFQDGVLKKS